MGYLGRRIGLSQDTGNSSPTASDVGGGILDLFAQGYFQRQGNIYNAPGVVSLSGLTATGGVISDYTDGPAVYRAHIFTSTGSFDVTSAGDFGNNIDFLVVGGGGGGSFAPGPANGGRGGGGAGGLRTNAAPSFPHNLPSSTMAYPGSGTVSYTVTVGAGGNSGQGDNGTDGGNSSIVHPSLNSGTGIIASGGGYGAYEPGNAGGGGGSGGGGAYTVSNGGATEASPDGLSPTTQGFAGGPGGSGPNYGGGGGGGATAAGQAGGNAGAHTAGYGGAGLQVAIAGPTATTFTGVGAKNPSNNQYQYFAGGGGGGGGYPEGSGPKGAVGGVGGGGNGADGPHGDDAVAQSGESGTGGGGGGGTGYVDNSSGNGGSGIVIVRYQIGELTATAKASGGAISFYGGKTIHTFTSSGQFICPGPFSETCEYVVIGGGGSGGSGSANTNNGGSGGGAGTYRTNSVAVTSGTYNITVGAGGGKNNGSNNGSKGGTTTLAFPTSVDSPGGGYGYPGPTPGYQGGSSGGSISSPLTADGDPFPGTIGATPTSGWGHVGNNSPSTPAYNAGGGGGAGGAAPPQPGANLSPGGLGIQIPSTFRNPASTVGAPGPTSPSVTGADTSGKYYVAGGGGGAAGHPQPEQPKGGDGGGPGGPYAGAGNGGGIDPNGNTYTGNGSDALMNTGSGGGGGPTGDNTFAGGGGSGIVLIAYPT